MPKYYIQDGVQSVIQEAKTPEEACAKAILNKFTTFMVNGVYNVSEEGFESKNQIPVASDVVMEVIYDMIKDLEDEDNDHLF